MKIRNGFVSNSSSSSFIVIGTELTSREVDDLSSGHFPDNEQNVWVRTQQNLSEGEEFFKLLPEMIKHLPYTKFYNWDFYKVVDMISDGGRVKPEYLGNNMIYIESDYHQPKNEFDFVKRFIEEDRN